MGRLEGMKALVTGGSGGIGAAVCREMAAEGARVGINHYGDKAGAERVLRQICDRGSEAIVVEADVSDAAEVERMVTSTRAAFGELDILVALCGISPKRESGEKIPVEEIEESQWDQVQAVNLKGHFLCCKAVIPSFKQRRRGKIVTMSSIVGKTGESGPAGAHYAASKGAIIAFTRAMAKELAPYHIVVNCVAPGWIETPLTARISAAIRDSIMMQIPMGRGGRPEEVARTIVFLCSEEASYMTGCVVDINGGWLMD